MRLKLLSLLRRFFSTVSLVVKRWWVIRQYSGRVKELFKGQFSKKFAFPGIPPIFYFITLSVAAGYFYVYLFSMVWFVFWRCKETGDLIAGMVVFSLGISSEIGTMKLIFMFIYKNEIQELVDQYLACDAIVKSKSRFSGNLLKTLRDVKKRAMIFWLVIIGNGVVYIVKPLVMPGRHVMEDSFILYGLEPTFETPHYEIVYTLMFLGVIFTCYLPANITAFLIIISGYTEAQMLALSEEMLNLWDDALEHYRKQTINNIAEDATRIIDIPKSELVNKKILNEYVRDRLNDIIKIHTTNINLLHQVEHVFRGPIAVEFMLLIIALIVELLGGLENTYMEVPFALMQVAMDCLTGQRVLDASATFEKAVYACKWENFDAANMKTVQLMLQNSQKTMKLSAGGVTMLSFSCLMTVIRSIYSAYTTLRSTMS